jgi:hypothetical protein
VIEQPSFDFSAAASGWRRREQGIRDVTANDLEALTGLLARVRDVASERRRFTVDEVRDAAEAAGDVLPRHPNGWAALFVNACKAGIIKPTREFPPSRRPSSHRRRVQVWVSQIVRDHADAPDLEHDAGDAGAEAA